MQIYYFWQNIQNLPKIINGFYNLITMFTSFAPGMPEKDSTRQAIADSWPNKMDDVCARKEWGKRSALPDGADETAVTAMMAVFIYGDVNAFDYQRRLKSCPVT